MKKYFLSALLFGFANSSWAVTTVNSPTVTKGETEFNIGLEHEFDGNKAKDNKNVFETEIEHSFTDYWSLGLEAATLKESGSETRYELTEIENTFQFSKQNESNFFSTGLRAGYEVSYIGADEFKVRYLLKREEKNFHYIFNLGLDKQIGKNSEKGLIGDFRTQLAYHVNNKVDFAIEYYADTKKKLDNMPKFSEQEHQVGPVLFYELAKNAEIEVGTLFGVTKESPDTALKIIFEYEF
jgi:hypothetical protein